MKKRILPMLLAAAFLFAAGMTPLSAKAEETVPAGPGFYMGEEGFLELYGDGTGVQNVKGYDWPVRWDETCIYDEAWEPAAYTFENGILSFGREGGDGYYTYEYEYIPEGNPGGLTRIITGGCLEGTGFFDTIDDEPYFAYSAEGVHYGYEEDYRIGCGVWCAVADYESSVSATSVLAPQGGFSYEPGNVTDGDRSDAWVEGANGYGVGESISITRRYGVADEDYGIDFNGVCIVNGYARDEKLWEKNSRAEDLLLYFNGGYVCTLRLFNSPEPQFFDLSHLGIHADSGEACVFTFEIASVYKGTKYKDTAITGIEFSFWTPNH